MKKLWSMVLVMMLIVSLVGCGTTNTAKDAPKDAVEQQGGELKVGVILPMSGNMALLGNEIYDAINIAAEMKNKQGGVNGKKIVLAKSDAPDASAGSTQANRLVNTENIKLIVGTYSSGIAAAAIPVAMRANASYIEVNAVADEITEQGYKYIWRSVATANMMGSTASKFAAEYLVPQLNTTKEELRVAIIHEDSSWGTSVSNGVRETAKANGLNIVCDEGYSAKSNDLSPIILKLIDAKPDVVIASSYIADAMLLQKQAQQFNFRPKAWVGTSAGHALSDYGASLGAASEGIFVADLPGIVNDKALDEDAIKLKNDFLAEWNSSHNKAVTGLSMGAFTGAWAFFNDVLPQCKTFDAEEIRGIYFNLDKPTGSMSDGMGVKYDSTGQNERAYIAIEQWQGGALEAVWPENIATKQPNSIPLPAYK
ncbi:ABC transporter substrate-binding protein [Desulfitobacterium chlororespirans]|uniref:Branched-chain amino acid transport system substrate-binding protein n=1 Tax=Desulfitobacterium chlororespirans DSM 11544 TaxID=1121395 RepID=A0A1M7UG01_9FIRM|nr:ABC transporter substrate-binding protein [Desulfitobacterium chlororespirans]SHN81922.1 branched-chain amino acid transport system substrate-binding protein [Desulfitobacterium chlororespirans DSM 11544]